MDAEIFRDYCLSKPSAVEDFPFDEDVLVFKVGGKMFALTSLERLPFQFNLKCDPEWAVELRASYDGVIPGWHMNKRHWNTVLMDGSISTDLAKKLIDHSYDLVVAKLPKKIREHL